MSAEEKSGFCEWCSRAEVEALYSSRADGHLEECPTPFRAPSDAQVCVDSANQPGALPMPHLTLAAVLFIALLVGLGYLWGAS